MKLSLKHKILIANLIVFILTFLVITVIVLEGLKTSNERMVVKNLTHQAEMSSISIRQTLLIGESPSATEEEFTLRSSELAFRLSSETGTRTLVFSRSRVLLADSDSSGTIRREFPELMEVFRGNRAYVFRNYNSLRYLFFSFPVILSGDSIVGGVIFMYPMKNTDNSLKNLEILLLVSFIAGALVIVAISLLLSLGIIRPITKLKNSAVQIANGSFGNRIAINSGDEVGDLANAFNVMSREIENRITALNLEKEKQKQFVTNISHELKTPLTTILGYIELLAAKGDDGKIFETSVQYLQSAGERLSVLINDLVDLSSLSRYEFEIEPELTDITALVRDIAGQMAPKAGKFNIQLHVEMPETLMAFVDPARMKQAVVNIIDNSIKYSSGDEIIIRLKGSSEGTCLEISDNGCGIPEEFLDKIFEPFYRVDKARARSLGGNGLGLAITREIVEKHKGEITIDSTPGQGTKVTIKLPAGRFC